MDHWHQ